MTQNSTISVRNTAVAATIPTFEEVYAMDYVQESIRTLVMENSRKYPMMASYEDDIKQEMLIYLAQSLETFDPTRASIQTYSRMALLIGLRRARRYYFTETQKVLSQAVQIEKLVDAEKDSLDMSVSSEIRQATESYSDTPFDVAERKEAFYAALDKLSPEDRKIANAIMNGIPLREFSKRNICNNFYLYEHAIPTIKRVLVDNFF